MRQNQRRKRTSTDANSAFYVPARKTDSKFNPENMDGWNNLGKKGIFPGKDLFGFRERDIQVER